MVCDLPKVTKLVSDRLDLGHFAVTPMLPRKILIKN